METWGVTTLLSFLILFLFSCEQQPTVVITQVESTYQNYSLNGKKSIDSLKDLYRKELKNGNFNKAIELCETVSKLDSNDADNLSNLSMFYLIGKDYEKGLKAVNKSIYLDTGNHFTHNYAFKACLFREQNNTDSANFYFNKMLKTKYYGLELNALADAFFKLQLNEKGYEYNNLILNYYPYNEEANLIEAIRVYQAKPMEGIRILNRLEEKIKTLRVYQTRAIAYHNIDKFELALRDANRVVDLSNGAGWSFAGRGRTKHLMKDYKGAESDYKIAIEKGDTSAIRFDRLLKAEITN